MRTLGGAPTGVSAMSKVSRRRARTSLSLLRKETNVKSLLQMKWSTALAYPILPKYKASRIQLRGYGDVCFVCRSLGFCE